MIVGETQELNLEQDSIQTTIVDFSPSQFINAKGEFGSAIEVESSPSKPLPEEKLGDSLNLQALNEFSNPSDEEYVYVNPCGDPMGLVYIGCDNTENSDEILVFFTLLIIGKVNIDYAKWNIDSAPSKERMVLNAINEDLDVDSKFLKETNDSVNALLGKVDDNSINLNVTNAILMSESVNSCDEEVLNIKLVDPVVLEDDFPLMDDIVKCNSVKILEMTTLPENCLLSGDSTESETDFDSVVKIEGCGDDCLDIDEIPNAVVDDLFLEKIGKKFMILTDEISTPLDEYLNGLNDDDCWVFVELVDKKFASSRKNHLSSFHDDPGAHRDYSDVVIFLCVDHESCVKLAATCIGLIEINHVKELNEKLFVCTYDGDIFLEISGDEFVRINAVNKIWIKDSIKDFFKTDKNLFGGDFFAFCTPTFELFELRFTEIIRGPYSWFEAITSFRIDTHGEVLHKSLVDLVTSQAESCFWLLLFHVPSYFCDDANLFNLLPGFELKDKDWEDGFIVTKIPSCPIDNIWALLELLEYMNSHHGIYAFGMMNGEFKLFRFAATNFKVNGESIASQEMNLTRTSDMVFGNYTRKPLSDQGSHDTREKSI
ncbi:OLC1v1036369C1 [Oldenlandia corymbosa var. corymbosa]|uniref:OLC1v1036369C1 n=1 Tax=Oldenlandia corymbosa var. corymbosa TaxID=529605 RepID=A0AAV1CVU8_OLDCO|nr:OLC1v1036369C1 [Oldenlandia corymbosa var. corymbosa]